MALTVKSMTSGLPLYAKKIKESNIRRLLGLPHIQLNVHGSGLGKRHVQRLGWYRPADIEELPESERAEVVGIKKDAGSYIHGIVDA